MGMVEQVIICMLQKNYSSSCGYWQNIQLRDRKTNVFVHKKLLLHTQLFVLIGQYTLTHRLKLGPIPYGGPLNGEIFLQFPAPTSKVVPFHEKKISSQKFYPTFH